MYVQRIQYTFTNALLADNIADIVSDYLSTLRMNGQVCGREWPLYRDGDALFSVVLTPEETSLARSFNTQYAHNFLLKLEALGCTVSVVQANEDVQGCAACVCAAPSAYVLYTNYVSLESPVRCLDCFDPVSLYRSDEPMGID